jgi:hypothetical protein
MAFSKQTKEMTTFAVSFQFRHPATPTATFEFLDALVLKQLPIINNDGRYR